MVATYQPTESSTSVFLWWAGMTRLIARGRPTKRARGYL